jgi:glycosyltransferase involved in cell wall biosynthesis
MVRSSTWGLFTLNVLHLTLSFRRSGRCNAILTLVKHLRSEGMRFDLGCLEEFGCSVRELQDINGAAEVFPRRSAFDLRASRHLDQFCQQRRIDVIHAHDAASQYLAALTRLRRPRYRMLMTFHRSLDFESATLRARIRNAFANSLSDVIVTGSRERQQHFLATNYVSRRKVIRIPFGIDMDRFRPDPLAGATVRKTLGLSQETFVIGAVGHFGPEKGIDVVVRGFRKLASGPLRVPVALVVFGSGTIEQQEKLQALARSVPSAPILFPGFHGEMHRWLRAFDLFVHAPRLEAFGLVLVEAMATQLPIIATRVGGVPDIVREGETGLLMSPEAPEELADAMARIIGDPCLRHSLATQARKVALEQFNAEQFAQRYYRVYQAMLDGRIPVGVDQEANDVSQRGESVQVDPEKPADMHPIRFQDAGA